MAREGDLITGLVEKFSFMAGKVSSSRPRRIFAEVPYGNFREVFEYAAGKMGFSILCTITGLDEGQTFAFLYHLAAWDGTTLNLKTAIAKENAVLKTIMDYFPSAEIYEREIEDLFGVKVEGLPSGKRYPLPDNWPEGEYPLRKDWKGEGQKKF